MFKSVLEVTGKENIEQIIMRCTTCRIAMTVDGKPYIIPMVFGYDWSGEQLELYFHCGLCGTKNRALKEGVTVCFEMDIEGPLMGNGRPAHLHSRAFESIVGEGTVSFAATEEEKRRGFDFIMTHQTGEGEWEYASAYLAAAEVFRISVSSMRAARKEPDQPAQHREHFVAYDDTGVIFDESHGF